MRRCGAIALVRAAQLAEDGCRPGRDTETAGILRVARLELVRSENLGLDHCLRHGAIHRVLYVRLIAPTTERLFDQGGHRAASQIPTRQTPQGFRPVDEVADEQAALAAEYPLVEIGPQSERNVSLRVLAVVRVAPWCRGSLRPRCGGPSPKISSSLPLHSSARGIKLDDRGRSIDRTECRMRHQPSQTSSKSLLLRVIKMPLIAEEDHLVFEPVEAVCSLRISPKLCGFFKRTGRV